MENLASLMRPSSTSEVIGQKHLLGENGIIRKMIVQDKLFSMILYGVPGIGKTSIANAIINEIDTEHRFLNASFNNKADFERVFIEARTYGNIVLVVDEIHRLNKDKQDILLPKIESGLITLIGLTTSNPYHSINKAIRSRCHLFELKSITETDIKDALKSPRIKNYLENLKLDDDAREYIADLSKGDLRYAYSILELAHLSDNHVTYDVVKNLNIKNVSLSDKNEDGFYNQLSALQKSIRGSDVNASVHYLARLLASGDLEAINRRLQVIFYEDIGVANPSLGPVIKSICDAAISVGMPEATIILSNAAVLMALSPKSNSAYLAINHALSDIELMDCGDIPDNIKFRSSTYKYPHDYKDAYVKQQYLPDNIINRQYYIPKTTSLYESKLKEAYEKYKI